MRALAFSLLPTYPKGLGREMGTEQCLFSEAAGNLSSQDQLLLHWWPRLGEQQDAGKTRAGSSTAWMCEVHRGTRKEAARWVKHRQTEAEATAQPFSKAIKFPLLFKKKKKKKKKQPSPYPHFLHKNLNRADRNHRCRQHP